MNLTPFACGCPDAPLCACNDAEIAACIPYDPFHREAFANSSRNGELVRLAKRALPVLSTV